MSQYERQLVRMSRYSSRRLPPNKARKGAPLAGALFYSHSGTSACLAPRDPFDLEVRTESRKP